jgi:hypothetical protein
MLSDDEPSGNHDSTATDAVCEDGIRWQNISGPDKERAATDSEYASVHRMELDDSG